MCERAPDGDAKLSFVFSWSVTYPTLILNDFFFDLLIYFLNFRGVNLAGIPVHLFSQTKSVLSWIKFQ